MFVNNLAKYIQSKDDKKVEPPKRKRQRKDNIVPETDNEFEIEVTDLTDINLKRKTSKQHIDKDDSLVISLLFSCMYIGEYRDVVDAVVNFDSVVPAICKCSMDELNGIIRMYGNDYLNAVYLNEYETVKCCVQKANN